MNKDYELLIKLTDTLEKSIPLTDKILENGKEAFSKNNESINIAIGILNEINEISLRINLDTLLLNKQLYDSILELNSYTSKLFNKFMIVNTYKLYDALKINVLNLKKLLDSFNK